MRDEVLNTETWDTITRALNVMSLILDCIEAIEAHRQVTLCLCPLKQLQDMHNMRFAGLYSVKSGM